MEKILGPLKIVTPHAYSSANFSAKVLSKSFLLTLIDALTLAAAKKTKPKEIQTSFNAYSHAKISILGTGVQSSVYPTS